ncbi:MAG TPA: hypothetical protein VIY48_04275 [Candidatus Paceibacterota bacterium]
MDFSKVLSFLSPAYGAITGQGLGKALPWLSPAYGMASGQGPFGQLLSALLGHKGMGGGQATDYQPIQGSPQNQPAIPNYALPGATPMPGQMPGYGNGGGVMGAGYGTGGPLQPGFNPYLANV